MANEVEGTCTCPLCKSEYAQEVRKSEKSGKPYINCEECGAQIFARQPASVKIMRGLIMAAPVVVEPVEKVSPEEIAQRELQQHAQAQMDAAKVRRSGATFFD